LNPIKVMFDIQTEVTYNELDIMDRLVKGVTLQSHQCQIQIERSERKEDKGTFKKVYFMIVPFDELPELVLKHPKTSIHEITGNKVNRMYFDIESKG